VHGGARFREPVVIDKTVRAEIAALEALAPLHNAPALDAIEEARRTLPDVPHAAVFDTAFHATIPDEAATYAVRQEWRDWGVRRYGFHGLSVQWAAEQVRIPRLVVCHLGGGCSVTAVRDGRSVDTTMGFSPLEGVPMATRSGSVDPGALLHLLRTGLTVDELDHALEHESGLLGLSGVSGDVRELEADGSPAASAALAHFAYRVATTVGAMAVALEGLDALELDHAVDRDDALGQRRLAGAGADDEVGAARDGTGAGCERSEGVIEGRRRHERLHAHCAASHTRSGVIGSRCTRAPITFAIPFATAPAVGTQGGSPTPFEPFGPAFGVSFSIQAMSMRGASDAVTSL